MKLTDKQTRLLKKLAAAKTSSGAGGMSSVLLTRAEMKSFAAKGLAWTPALHAKDGKFPAFITEAGRSIAAAL